VQPTLSLEEALEPLEPEPDQTETAPQPWVDVVAQPASTDHDQPPLTPPADPVGPEHEH